MPCAGCGKTFSDKAANAGRSLQGTVPRSSCYYLCYNCFCVMLEVYPSTPKERLPIYTGILEKGYHIPLELIRSLQDELEESIVDLRFLPRFE